MAKRKVTAEELLAGAESNLYEMGAHREKDSTRDCNRQIDKTEKDRNATLELYVLWTHSEMVKDSTQRGLQIPDEASARQHCLYKGIDAPHLATVKDFLRSYKIVEKPTADSINTFAEWFFAGFTWITGKLTDKDDRSEVYKARTLPSRRGGSNLTRGFRYAASSRNA